MRTYLTARWFATVIALIYLGIRLEIQPSWISELVLYNAVVAGVIVSIWRSPNLEEISARWGLVSAIAIWGIGSVTSSIDSFFGTNLVLVAEVAYALFYPIALFALIRTLRHETKSKTLELVDTLLIAFSGTTLIASLLLRSASLGISGSPFQVFLSILYPIGDLVLLLTIIAIVMVQRINLRNLFILAGVTTFAFSDFYFLLQSQNGNYTFGSLSDVGWLVAFILFAEATWHRGDETAHGRALNPAFVTIALVLSTLILAIAALRPDYFPRFVIAPALITIALAFLRMYLVMRELRQMNEERVLARTDELTGLANRRRFLAELEEFRRLPGSLLIMDLDGFKTINDQLGHEVGDALLAQVARRFQRVIPGGALLARLGGDEFAALVPGDEGYEVALAIRATLSYPFQISGNAIRLDVSIGEARNDATTAQHNLLRCADEAMYEAKRRQIGLVSWAPVIRN